MLWYCESISHLPEILYVHRHLTAGGILVLLLHSLHGFYFLVICKYSRHEKHEKSSEEIIFIEIMVLQLCSSVENINVGRRLRSLVILVYFSLFGDYQKGILNIFSIHSVETKVKTHFKSTLKSSSY